MSRWILRRIARLLFALKRITYYVQACLDDTGAGLAYTKRMVGEERVAEASAAIAKHQGGAP